MSTKPVVELSQVIVRFAGDSGDGMQLTGSQFTSETALLGNDIVRFEIEGVSSGNTTQGHRILGNKDIPVTIDTFEQQLRDNFVELNSDARYHRIADFVEAAGAKLSINGDGHPTPLANRLRASIIRDYIENRMPGILVAGLH